MRVGRSEGFWRPGRRLSFGTPPKKSCNLRRLSFGTPPKKSCNSQKFAKSLKLFKKFGYLKTNKIFSWAIFIRHSGLVRSAPAWDGTGCEFDSWQCRICIILYISHVHWAYDYLGPFGVLWVHMAWHKNCVRVGGLSGPNISIFLEDRFCFLSKWGHQNVH